MIDIHCHILPGVDDGAANMEIAVAMARLAYEDGIQTIIATPHYNRNWLVDATIVRQKTEELQLALDHRGIDIRIEPGNELRLENSAFVYDALEQKRCCHLADNERFLLLEQAWEGFHPETTDVVEWLQSRRTTIIVPHPERHQFFRAKPTLLEDLLERGAWTQVSVDSLLGNNGPEAQAFAFMLIDRGWAHTLATDAHNLRRKPNLSLGYKIVEQRAGKAAVRAILDRMAGIVG